MILTPHAIIYRPSTSTMTSRDIAQRFYKGFFLTTAPCEIDSSRKAIDTWLSGNTCQFINNADENGVEFFSSDLLYSVKNPSLFVYYLSQDQYNLNPGRTISLKEFTTPKDSIVVTKEEEGEGISTYETAFYGSESFEEDIERFMRLARMRPGLYYRHIVRRSQVDAVLLDQPLNPNDIEVFVPMDRRWKTEPKTFHLTPDFHYVLDDKE